MIRSLMLTAAALTLFAAAPARADDAAPAKEALSPAQKAEVASMIHDYIVKNPQVLIEGLNAYQKQQQDDQSKNFDKVIGKYKAFLTSPETPSAGNPKGTHTVVEFFDYNCGYCKHAVDDVLGLIKYDPQIKVYFKDMPILAPSSGDAAKYALAAGKQGKYFEYHVALMKSTAPREKATFLKIGKDLGLDTAKLESDATNDKGIQDTIAKNLDAARVMAIQGTPGFIIGDKLFDGYMGADGMKRTVAAVYGGGGGKDAGTDADGGAK